MILLLSLLMGVAQAVPLTLEQTIRAALAHSEALKASAEVTTAAELKISQARSGYLPTLQAEAITTGGFPGSTGLLGIGGIMGSPYRSGTAYGLVATETLYDFGRTSGAVQAARDGLELARTQSDLERARVQQAALGALVSCAFARTQAESWLRLHELAAVIRREVERFISTGQRSIVDSYLVRTQVDEAIRKGERFREQEEAIRRRLAVLTGMPVHDVECQGLSGYPETAFAVLDRPGETPEVRRARLQVQAANDQIAASRSNYYPRLVGLASVGQMESARLVKEKDYALGLGLIWPLYEGGRTNAEVEGAKVLREQRQHELFEAQDRMALVNAQFDESLNGLRVELQHLSSDLKDAQNALDQARKRYFAMQGNLADLREAVRNLAKIEDESSSYQAQYLQALGLKAIFNQGSK